MLKLFGDAQIVKATVVSENDSVIVLKDVVIQPRWYKIKYRNSQNDCLCLSSPTFIVPMLNMDVRDANLQLPYETMQEVRRLKNARVSR